MKKLTLFFIIAILLGNILVNSQQNNQIIDKKIKVKFQEAMSVRLAKLPHKIDASVKGYAATGFIAIDKINKKHSAVHVKRMFPDAGKYEMKHIKYGLHLWYEISFSGSIIDHLDEIINDYKAQFEIQLVEPFYSKRLIEPNGDLSETIHTITPLMIADDPLFSDQWHYNNTGQTGGTPGADINLIQAWDVETGDTSVIVAIIDGGIDIDHEDLADAVWINYLEFYGSPGVDDDNNGYIDDVHGYSFVSGSPNIIPHYHGVHVSGTIGAITNNGIGVSGIAGGSGTGDGVRLMSCAVFGDWAAGGFEQAFIYAADNGAVISQNSWGYTSPGYYEQSVIDAIDYFIDNAGYDENDIPYGPMQGGLVIFAAGNDNDDGEWYPGYYEKVISVAATDHNDVRSYFSNYGDWVEIAAPGSDVLSTYPDDGYNSISGTSMACPHVSGVAALIVSKFGGVGYRPEMVWDRLIFSADNIDSQNPDFINLLGSGRVNAFNALQENDSLAPNQIDDFEVVDTGVVSVTLSWTATGCSADSGTASLYDLRYSTAPIDSANFNLATQVNNVKRPAAAGETETFKVTGLLPSNTYYFAIKAADFFGNISEISNIVFATTYPAPEISVFPTSLSEIMDSGQILTRTLNIENTGEGDLEFYFSGFGDTLDLLDIDIKVYAARQYKDLEKGETDDREGGPALQSFGDDGIEGFGYRWIDSDEPNGPEFNWNDISYTGTVLYLGDDDYYQVDLPFVFSYYGEDKNTVYISSNGFITFNSSGAGSYTNQPIPDPNAPNDLIAPFWDDLYPPAGGTIYYLANETNFIVQYQNVEAYGGYGYYTFQVILQPSGAILFQYLNTSGDVQYSTVGIENQDGTDGMEIAFNTNYIEDSLAILISYYNYISQIIPSSGTIMPGNSSEITIEFDATDFIAGDYFSTIKLISNDPVTPITTIPTHMHINGIPSISISPDSIDFEQKFVDYTHSLQLKITNSGTDTLSIYEISSDNDAFTVSSVDTMIASGRSLNIEILFLPENTIAYNGVLEILSNAINSPVLTVPLKGIGILPPIISISPDSLGVSLFTEDTLVEYLNIDNSLGGSNLEIELSVSYINKNNIDTSENIEKLDFTSSREIDDREVNKRIHNDEAKILIIQDYYAWGIDMYTFIYDNFAIVSNVISSYEIISTDFSGYDLIITVGDQSSSYYFEVSSNVEKFEEFVSNGGIVQYQLATQGDSVSIAGGSSVIFGDLENYNIVVEPSHPIVEGLPSVLEGSSANHCTIHNLPDNAMIITKTEYSQQPTTVEYNYGHGKVIVTGMTWEFLYNYGYPAGEMLYNAVNYSLSTSGSIGWLNIENVIYTIPAGENIDIPIKFDARGLYGGDYNAEIIISSNDPENTEEIIPAHLFVTGVPRILISGEYDSTSEQMYFVSGATTNHTFITTNPSDGNGTFEITLNGDYNSLSEYAIVYIDDVQLDTINPFTTGITIQSYTIAEGELNEFMADGAINISIVNSYEVNTGYGDIHKVHLTYSFNNDSLNFGEQFLDYTSVREINIKNIGTDTLRISSIESDIPEFVPVSNQITIAPEDNHLLEVAFTPVSVNNYIAELTILSNDPVDSILTIVLEGEGILPPIISVSPDSLDADLLSGDSTVQYITIDNSTGGSNLYWTQEIGVVNTSKLNSIIESHISEGFLSGDKLENAKTGKLEYATYVEKRLLSADSVLTFDNGPDGVILGGSMYWDSAGGGHLFCEYYDNDDYIYFPNPVYIEYFEMNGLPWEGYYGGDIGNIDVNGYDIDNVLVWSTTVDLSGSTDWATWVTVTVETRDISHLEFKAPGNEPWYNGFWPSIDNIHIGEPVNWLILSQESGTIPAGSSEDIEVVFNATGLYGGDYNAEIVISSNDPVTPEVIVPAHLSVTGVPRISISGQFDSTSEQTYYSSGANTEHIFITSNSTDSDGTLKITIEGDFESYEEYALIYIENILLDSINPTTTSQTVRSYSIPKDELNEYILDGTINVSIVNSYAVNYGYADRHAVRLAYSYCNDSIDFRKQFITYSNEKEIAIGNIGTDTLIISSIESSLSEFAPSVDQITIGPENSYTIHITFTPESAIIYGGILTIRSNDPVDSVLYIDLTGEGILPPVISVTPDSMGADLFTGDTLVQNITIDNTTGGSELIYEIFIQSVNVLLTSPAFESERTNELKEENNLPTIPQEENIYSEQDFKRGKIKKPATFTNELENVLSEIEDRYTEITELIPNYYEFSNGETGNYISDGGNDMYDGGNYLSTNLGAYLQYSNNSIVSSPILGTNGQYFTTKKPGLFIFAADVDNINYFTISGNLGADGSGYVNGSVLEINSKGKNYLGFVKRVYESYDPSVNHLIIIQDNGLANHEFSTYSDDDYHQVNNLNGVTRIYYLLFAGASSDYYNDIIMGQIMEQFLDIVGEGSSWLSTEPVSGIVSACASEDINVVFNATGLYGGDYNAEIIITSNDPATPEVIVPAHLSVTGIPQILISGEYDSTSEQMYYSSGASTKHIFLTPNPSDTDGKIQITIQGDYDNASEYVDVYLEDSLLMTINPTTTAEITQSIIISNNLLNEKISDGKVEVTLMNSIEVNPGYNDIHIVRLIYTFNNDSIEFGKQFIDYTKQRVIPIQNVGTDTLHITSIESDITEFVPFVNQISIAPEDEYSLEIDFTPTSAVACTGQLTILSNDPVDSIITIILEGEGILPPVISVTPDSLDAALFTGDTLIQYLTIDNSAGASDLEIDLTVNLINTNEITSSIASNKIIFNSSEEVDSRKIDDRDFNEDAQILVIQDYSAWGLDMYYFIYENFGIISNVISSGEIASCDFSNYDLIITVGDQSSSYYWQVSDNVSKFEEFLNNGGVIQYQLATQGDSVDIAGVPSVIYGLTENYNIVVETTHPIVEGLPSVLEGNWANHCIISNLPANATIITQTQDSQLPTTVEYNYGQGKVIATGMTWEYLYNSSYPAGQMLYNAVYYSLSESGSVGWLSIDNLSYIIPAGENIDIPVRFDATGLYGGDYNAEIIISSNDPITPEEIVPAHLSVTGAPRISIFGQFDSTSEQGYYSTGASTEHIFNTSNIADSDGTLKVTIEGDFNSSSEYAIVFIETIFLDSINPTTTGQTIRSYTIPKDELNGYILDGIVEVRIENSIAVDYGYADIHTVRLTYTYNNDSIDFGQQYISYTSNREITIENTGTDTLIVSSIESNLPEFVPDLDQITIGPEDFYALNIAFTPEAAIVYNGILTIRSNDPVDSVLYIDITGEGILPPVISVTPDSMDVALFTGDTLTQYLTIDNTNGGSDLVYSISTTSTMNIEKRVINNPSGYMSDFNKPNPYEIPVEYSNSKPIKLKPDNIILSSAGRLFGFNYESDLIVELDMSDGTVINSMYQPVETDWGELAFDGELLYFSTNNFVTVINSTLTMILDSFTLNVPVTIDGLGHTGEYLVGVSYENNEIYLFDDETGEVINTIIPGVSIGGGLTFGGDRNTVFTGFGPIYEIEIETGIVLNSFSSVGTVYSLAYSNANGILISNNESSGTIDFYNPDDGTHLYSFDAYGIRGLAADEAANGINNWLSLNVYEGVVAAGSSQNINVLFDATGLYGGLYEANITINSNDPVTPEVIVPVHLSVTGAPDIYISDEYNPCIFGEQYVGYTSMLEILIENIGTDTLNISSIESDLPEFIPNISQLTLAPEEDYTIDISFTPAAEIFYSGQLTILSDDPNESILNILLEGQGVLPPIMTVLPESMDVVLFSEDSLVEYLIIDNTEGGSDLVFEINTSYIAAGNLMKNTDKNIYGLNNNGIETDSYFKDKYPLAVGDFISKSPSPLPLTCLSVNPNTGLIYAQENYGYNFYKYSPYEDTWTSLTSCPISSGNNGGATYLEGKIYTSYTGNDQIGVYDILSDSWSTLISQVYGAGNITTDSQNIYLVNGYEFAKYNPDSSTWTTLASPAIYFECWGGLAYYENAIYGHSGNGNSSFAKYDIITNTWSELPYMPSGATLGCAIDPVDKIYYTYGSYGGNNWYAFNLKTQNWSVNTIPFFFIYDGGLVYVGQNGVSGIYFIEGEEGTGFGCFETKAENYWLTIYQDNGVIPAGEMEQIPVIFKSFDLDFGDYNAKIQISSNDQGNSEVIVPVHMMVTDLLPPELANPVNDTILKQNFGTYSINLKEVFYDPNDYILQYSANSNLPNIVDLNISDSILTIEGVGCGQVTITVRAENKSGFASDNFVLDIECCNKTNNIIYTICQGDSIEIMGRYLSTAGNYYDTLLTAEGCDSIIISTLIVNPVYYIERSITIIEGDSCYAGGAYRKSPGLYIDSLLSSSGCDSIEVTELIVLVCPITTVDTSICNGENYFAGGAYQSASGTYYDTLKLINGCDSVIITNLTVESSYEIIIDTTICDGESYYAGGDYQTVSGIYFDSLKSDNNCDIIIITTLTVDICDGYDILTDKKELKVYPVPTDRYLRIEYDEIEHIELYDNSGALVLKTNDNIIDFINYKEGFYFINIFNTNGYVITRKVIYIK